MGQERFRCFLGVMLPASEQAQLYRRTAPLRAVSDAVNWVTCENLHITLRFFGQVPMTDVATLVQALTSGVKDVPEFQVFLRGIGAFPRPDRPRTLWAGVGTGSEELIQLVTTIDVACSELGFRPEHRVYRPHVTLGRVKGAGVNPQIAQRLAEFDDQERENFLVDEIVLFQSQLRPSGPVYIPLASIPLAP